MSQRQPWRPRQGLGEEARTQEASNKGLAISLALFGSEAEAVILLIGLYGWFVWALQYGYPNEVERPDGKTVVFVPCPTCGVAPGERCLLHSRCPALRMSSII